MLEIDAHNTLDYLRDRGDISDLMSARVSLLGWGVSNVVLRVFRQNAPDFIIKQSRTQLRTKAAWFSRLDRIFREIGMLRLLEPMLPTGVIPKVLFEDRQNYLFAMDAFPQDHTVWKQSLLNGEIDPSIAAALGDHLSSIHRQTAFRSDLQEVWGDLEVFDQLRLDPFYRYLAQARPAAAPHLSQLIEETCRTSLCITLADFSPKNILISDKRIAIVDFETGHYGDPAFDLGFFLSHLLLKAARAPGSFQALADLTRQFWSHYWHGMEPWTESRGLAPSELLHRTWRHLAACMWARIDGKSPVDYLNDVGTQERVRRFCLTLFEFPPDDWEGALARLERMLAMN